VKTALLFLVLATRAFAGDTLLWSQSDYADFQKGVRTNLSIRSDGRLSLAPKTTEIYDSSTSYLWALARDSKGNIYTAGGPGASLFRIAAGGGKPEKVAQFDALEIHAIAIDAKDRVYAATAPDGKVYRIEAGGKSSVFYDPKQKYIWAMLCDAAGDLYIATGDQGEIHKVTPEGNGEVFFKSDETHIRSLAFDREGSLIAGTEPGGLVIRISPKGEGFVLYQMVKREVTALAVGAKNEIYAAAVGIKSAPRAIAIPTPPAPVAAPPPAPAAGPTTAPAAASPIVPATVPGGSDVYVIPSQESPSKIWNGAQDVVYAMALDPAGRLLIGAGNKGAIYRVEGHSLYQTLVTFPVEQVTSLLAEKDGTVYAATGNVGKVYKVGPGLEKEGAIESDVFDSGGFSRWGRLQAGAELNGGRIALTARSGNLDRPQKNWSAWSAAIVSLEGGRIASPPARFLQWKATLSAGPGDKSPWLDSVDAAYLRQNVAPKIEQVEITPYNYRFPAPSTPLTLSGAAPLTLPAMGSKLPSPHPATEANTYPSMTFQKGALGVRWTSSDENGDSLIYSVEIRGDKEQNWKLLRDKVHEKYYSFDSTAFPDGDYRIRITASDSPSNTAEDALTVSEESDPFPIDNTPPAISNLHAGGSVARWHAADALSTIYKAEYSLDGGEWTIVDPEGKLSDSKALDYVLTLKGLGPGEHVVAVRVSDENDNTAVEKTVLR
jgi:sugar lactone lactonase YvrE